MPFYGCAKKFMGIIFQAHTIGHTVENKHNSLVNFSVQAHKIADAPAAAKECIPIVSRMLNNKS